MNHVLTRSDKRRIHDLCDPRQATAVACCAKIGGHTHLFKNLRKIKQNDFHLQATGLDMKETLCRKEKQKMKT